MARDPWDNDQRKDPWDIGFHNREPWRNPPPETTAKAEPVDPRAYRLVGLSKSELIAGFIYLFLHFFVIATLIYLIFWALGWELSLMELNLIYMFVGTIYLAITMRRHLRESFVRFLHFGKSNLWVMPAGYGIRIALTIPVAMLVGIVLYIQGQEFLNPNEEVVRELIDQNFLSSFLMIVIFAPFVEELLFRSLLFAPLRKHSRFLAYFVSTLLFAFLHIFSALFFAFTPYLFLVMLLYVPAGISLAWAYEKSGSIWTAIFLHALMNLVAILLPSLLPDELPYYLFRILA